MMSRRQCTQKLKHMYNSSMCHKQKDTGSKWFIVRISIESVYAIFKAPYSSKIDILLSKKKKKKKINKLIYGINSFKKCCIWQPVKFQLVSRSWTGSKMKWFYCISELMLPTLTQRYDKKSFQFYPVQNWEIEILRTVRFQSLFFLSYLYHMPMY